MAKKNNSTLLILMSYRRSGRMAQWSGSALFLLEEVGVQLGSNPGVSTSICFFFFHRFFTLWLVQFIVTADPVSFARFLRKRISSFMH